MRCERCFSGLLGAALIAAALACHAPVPPPGTAPTPAPAAPANPGETATDSSAPYDGPAVAVTLNQNGSGPKATVKVTFPTAGWELKHDSSRVKDRFGVARLTFNGPAPDDMVAQVMEEKAWEWESPESFSRAEVWVRIVRRGQTGPSDYRLAAKAP
jgi:hypothetical protein